MSNASKKRLIKNDHLDRTHQDCPDSRSGVALIMVLGLLSVLTILCVAFAISMRVERQAARAFANNTRAEQLMSIAFVRSMERVNDLMRVPAPLLYPDFASPNPSRDVIASDGDTSPKVPDLRSGEALSFVPKSLQTEVDKVYAGGGTIFTGAAHAPKWDTEGIPGGRVAYLLINASGLLDVNLAGGTNARAFSQHIGELDLTDLVDITDLTTFLNDREEHVQYESTPEISELNDGVYEVHNLMYYSYDANRDEVFYDSAGPAGVELDRPPPGLGLRTVVLTNKFDLNAITNYAGYTEFGRYDGYSSDAAFMANYYNPLKTILGEVGMERPDDVAWNLINYLDPDRVPQGGNAYPWRHTEGGEAIPLVNEIVLHPGTDDPTKYQFSVELWYPFVPTNIIYEDEFYLHVSVFKNADLAALQANNELTIQDAEDPDWSYIWNITNMTYGTATEFIVARGPEMDVEPGGTNVVLRMLARVMKRDGSYVNPVDEAPGFRSGDLSKGGAGSDDTEGYYKRTLFNWTGPQGMSVNDPRVNGQIKYWTSAGNWRGGAWNNVGGQSYAHTAHTLGATNANCRPWGVGRQGTPIYAKNGIMLNIGELGHIFRSNLDDEDPANPYWRTIELMKKSEGAILLDVIDVHSGGKEAYGLVSINTRQEGVLGALFNNLKIGDDAIPGAGAYLIPDADIDFLVSEIIRYATSTARSSQQYMSFADLFEEDGGPLAEAFIKCAPDGHNSSDIYKEDTFRHISELITFRQNIFMVIGIAQALAPDGETVLAEKRAVATIYRDAYTGRHFTRSFKWLND